MWLAVLLFSVTLMSADAQSTLPAASAPWTVLDGTWRWHAGDRPEWASATWDDSVWLLLPIPGPLPPERQYWIRLPVQTGEMSHPGLLLGPIAYAYDVYWDGQPIGHFGDLARGRWFTPRWQTFPLPPPFSHPGRHVLALRIGQIGGQFGARGPQLGAGENRIGDVAALREAASAYMRADFQPRLLQLLIDCGLTLAGFYFLLLPSSVSPGAAFRWLGVMLLGRTLVVLLWEFYMNDGPLNLPGSVPTALVGPLNALLFIGPIEFAYALFRRRVPLAVRGLEGLIALLAVPFASVVFVAFHIYLLAAMIPVALAGVEWRKRTAEAGWTFLLFAILGAVTLDAVLVIAYHLRVPYAIYLAGFRIWFWDLALLLWVPAMAVQIHKTNLRFRDERERLRREMEAARHVQQLLLPSQSIQIPGFEIEVQYQPATEVGGDFFQLFPAAPDSLLLVVGDVSGKGMQAALLVSMVVGALRNRQSDRPSCVLQELNSVLLRVSEGGFTTCCCALFAPDGTVTLANAGHVAPYRNGEEITTVPGLPLGLTAEADWEEKQIQLQPGDRLLWISDGVIEARNGKRELLGFQRTQELAGQPTSEIVRTAQEFGQEDDITVLSITRQRASLGVASV